MQQAQQGPHRIATIDLARGVALVAMAIYHFTWDLEFFGYVAPGTAAVGGWKLFARCIASTFLVLVGVSLYLAHRNGVRLRPFLRRLAMVGGAALAISIVTCVAVPEAFIFFGILHQIAVASLLGLFFLRMPWPLTLALAAAFVAAPHLLHSTAFDAPGWWWTGLSETFPRSNDYVPVFPWFGAVLAGMAAAQAGERQEGLLERALAFTLPAWSQPLQVAGRHSLAFYLIHQPVLIACIWLFSQIVPAPPPDREAHFLNACQVQCQELRDSTFCTRYCGCVLGRITAENRMEEVFARRQSAEARSRLEEIAQQCTMETPGGGSP